MGSKSPPPLLPLPPFPIKAPKRPIGSSSTAPLPPLPYFPARAPNNSMVSTSPKSLPSSTVPLPIRSLSPSATPPSLPPACWKTCTGPNRLRSASNSLSTWAFHSPMWLAYLSWNLRKPKRAHSSKMATISPNPCCCAMCRMGMSGILMPPREPTLQVKSPGSMPSFKASMTTSFFPWQAAVIRTGQPSLFRTFRSAPPCSIKTLAISRVMGVAMLVNATWRTECPRRSLASGLAPASTSNRAHST
mmetsp:Transcript_94620/g.294754  ORF Transcript_94620/g.294754 Transcript_94620/m.294754 type:complete len:246 (+) Transcript_94620:193-930(+)